MFRDRSCFIFNTLCGMGRLVVRLISLLINVLDATKNVLLLLILMMNQKYILVLSHLSQIYHCLLLSLHWLNCICTWIQLHNYGNLMKVNPTATTTIVKRKKPTIVYLISRNDNNGCIDLCILYLYLGNVLSTMSRLEKKKHTHNRIDVYIFYITKSEYGWTLKWLIRQIL